MLNNIKLIAQSAIRIKNGEKVIYFDPYLIKDNYKNDADYIFITHSHYDHFSPQDINKIIKQSTKIIAPLDLQEKLKQYNNKIFIVEPNNNYEIDDIKFSTIRAYNIDKDYHKKDYNWVGYIINIADKKIYVAGDTDNNQDIQSIKCDIAFVPIGGTYTMNYKEAAEVINIIKPIVAIPTHYETIVGSEKDAYEFKKLVNKEIDVRIILGDI